MWPPQSPAIGSVRTIEPASAEGDVEIRQIRAAERAVCGVVFGARMTLDHGTIRSEDCNAGAGSTLLPAGSGEDVAAGVHAHAIDTTVWTKVVKYLAMAEAAIGLNGVRTQLAGVFPGVVALGDIEDMFIG